MKNFIGVLSFGILFSGFAFAGLPVLNPSQTAELNKNLQTCFVCHGNNGASGSMTWNAPRLAGQTQAYFQEQIANFLDKKRNNPFSRQSMWGMFDRIDSKLYPYIAEFFSEQQMASPPKTDAKLVAQGQLIYQNGIPGKNLIACKYCHGEDAKGNGLFPRLAGQDKVYLMTQILDWRNNYRNYAVPMPDVAKELSDQEMSAVTEFLSSLR